MLKLQDTKRVRQIRTQVRDHGSCANVEPAISAWLSQSVTACVLFPRADAGYIEQWAARLASVQPYGPWLRCLCSILLRQYVAFLPSP